MVQLKYMRGEELIRSILRGEKDFSGIRLKEGTDLNIDERFEEMQKYLKKEWDDYLSAYFTGFHFSPLSFYGSEMRHLKAHGIFLNDFSGRNTDFYGADFREADFFRADFKNAILDKADLRETNLHDAQFWDAKLRHTNLEKADLFMAQLLHADFSYANMRNTNLTYAHLDGSNLSYANLENALLKQANLRGSNLNKAFLRYTDLRHVIDLDYAENIEFAILVETKVTKKEKEIIDSIFSKLVVEEDEEQK